MSIKGYKIFDSDWKCRDFQYKMGETYEIKEKPVLCEKGFHFCIDILDCFKYYDCVRWNHIAEVEAIGDCTKSKDGCTKIATNKIKIIKEIEWNEISTIAKSYGVNSSDGVSYSEGVSYSNGANKSYGVSYSNGISYSEGVNKSYGVSCSEGVNESYGISNCYAVDNALFLANKKRVYTIFGKEVDEEYFNKVDNNFKKNLNNWTPVFNNLKSLYIKYGSEWKLTPVNRANEIKKEDAWKGMPIAAINYIRSIPEFDAEMFFEITGIKI